MHIAPRFPDRSWKKYQVIACVIAYTFIPWEEIMLKSTAVDNLLWHKLKINLMPLIFRW